MTRIAVAAAAALAVASPVAAQTWDIDTSHSSTQFAVRHLMVSTVRGHFGKTSGTVTFDGKNLSSLKVQATIDVSSIDTREASRDKHLKSADFFDVDKHPTATFVSKRVDAATASGFKLVGDLTLRGVTKEVTLDVQGPTPEIKGMRGESRIGATATTTINRQDFGISWSKALDGGGVVVSDQVQITIDLELVRKAS